MICNRVFTITMRRNKAVLFTNKVDSRGKRPYQKFSASSSNNAGIKALIKVLEIIPQEVEEIVAILAPAGVSCLGFAETRDFWLTNEVTKSGVCLSEETLELVYKLDELLAEKGDKVQIFSHDFVKAYKYRAEIQRAWQYTNIIIPIEYSETEMAEF